MGNNIYKRCYNCSLYDSCVNDASIFNNCIVSESLSDNKSVKLMGYDFAVVPSDNDCNGCFFEDLLYTKDMSCPTGAIIACDDGCILKLIDDDGIIKKI